MKQLLEAMPDYVGNILFALACGLALITACLLITLALSFLPWGRWVWKIRSKTIGPVWVPPDSIRHRPRHRQHYLGCVEALNADQVYPWDDLWLSTWPDTDVFTLTRVQSSKHIDKNYNLFAIGVKSPDDPIWGDHLRRALGRKRVMKKVAAIWKSKYERNPIRYAKCMEAIRGVFA